MKNQAVRTGRFRMMLSVATAVALAASGAAIANNMATNAPVVSGAVVVADGSPGEATVVAGASSKSKISVKVTSRTSSTVQMGSKITLKGKTSTKLKGKTVKLQKLSGRAWKTLKSAKVRASGTFTLAITPSAKVQTFKLRVYAPSSAKTKAAASPSYTYKVVKQKTSLKVTKRSSAKISVGSTVSFSGTASTSLKGKTVSVQTYAKGAWRTVASGKVTSSKTFAVKAKVTKAGAQKFRVYAPSTSRTNAAASSAYTYTAWAWYRLAGHEIDSADAYTDWNDLGRVGGKRYPDYVSFGWGLGGYNRDGWAEYNVNYSCTQFKAYVGMADESQTGAKRTFALRADDARTSFGTVGLGAAKPVTADISGAYRIRIEATLNGNTAWGMATFGTPQVYCSSSPF